MASLDYLHQVIKGGDFRFQRLEIDGIDNAPVLKINDLKMANEEICLFDKDVKTGNEYCRRLHDAVAEAMKAHRELPVVRFADGEYAFYRLTKGCNGLYQQAQSEAEIKKVMPFHINAMRLLGKTGKMAPLIFPGNSRSPKQGFLSLFTKSHDNSAASDFIEFLHTHEIEISVDNYIPFYVVYAYLVSEAFAKLVDGKKVCLVNSEFHAEACRDWFLRFSSRPTLSFAEIPDAYVATRWPSFSEKRLSTIPEEIDLFLVGAGVGALPVCVDLARHFSVPAIDSGHILNMMNAREDKSNGPRLYTILKRNNGRST